MALRSGRLLESPSPTHLRLLCEGRVIDLHGPSSGDCLPGDLVRALSLPDGTHALTRVHRPTRSPFEPDAETRRFALDGLADTLALRARALAAVRRCFTERGYLEVETPTVVRSPGLDVHVSAFDVRRADGRHFGHLVTSPEYAMKRMLVGGIHRCFQIARCARAEELGRRHQPSFTMLEWYRAWDGLDAVIDDTEAVVMAVEGAVGSGRLGARAPFPRITVREAFARYAPALGDPVRLANTDEERYFRALTEQVEPALGASEPTFLTRFPARHASLSRLCDDDPSVCERAELYALGTELCNGFHELTDPVEQRARFQRDLRERAEKNLAVYPIDEEFMAALEEGLSPCAGNALGFDRLLALVLGRDDIADVIAFPERT